jgi:hypothetical protein
MHQHTWYVTAAVLLSLPTHDGFAERLTAWHCTTCRANPIITGELRVGTPLGAPEFWDAQQAQEQRTQTPEARMAWRQQLRKIP